MLPVFALHLNDNKGQTPDVFMNLQTKSRVRARTSKRNKSYVRTLDHAPENVCCHHVMFQAQALLQTS